MSFLGYAPWEKIKKNRAEEAARLADPLAGLEERKAAFAKLQGGPVVTLAKEAFVRTPLRLGVTGAASVEDAYRLFRKKYDASTPERVTEGYNVPGFGQVKPFGAAKGATKETLKMPTFAEQSIEGVGAAVDIASTLAMASPAKAVKATVSSVAKLAKPFGIAERTIAKTANLGQRLLPKAGTLPRGMLRVGVQGTADASMGAVQSVAADLARGDVSAEDMKKNAATSALISTLLPVTIAGVTGTTRGVARQVGQKESNTTAARNIIRTVGEEVGLLDVSAASLERKGNLGRQFKTKMFERETELKDALEKLKADANTPKYKTVAGVSGKVDVDPALTKKIAATELQLKRTQQVRDLSTKWLDDRAPVMNNIAVLRQRGMDAQGEQDLMNLTEQSRVTDTVVTGELLQRYERMEELRPSDIPQDWWRQRVDEYADLKTKLETERNDLAGQALNKQRLEEIEGEFTARGDDSLQRLQQTHQDVVLARNMEELDKNVAAGLISPEEAARLKAENPNYSRLVALEYLDDESTARMFSSTRDASGKEWKARSEEARANFKSLGATEANALAAYASEARRTKNVQLTNLVDENVGRSTGVFTPIVTEADQIRKQQLIARQMELGEQKDELLRETKKKLDAIRKQRVERNALDAFRKTGAKEQTRAFRTEAGDAISEKTGEMRTGVKEDLARFKEGVEEIKGRNSAEAAFVREKTAEVEETLRSERKINADRNKFVAHLRSTTAALKKGEAPDAKVIAELRALIASRSGKDTSGIEAALAEIDRLNLERSAAGGRLDAAREIQKGPAKSVVSDVSDRMRKSKEIEQTLDDLSVKLRRDFDDLLKSEQAKRQAAMDGLADVRQKINTDIDAISEERKSVAKELFEINARIGSASGGNIVTIKRNGMEEIYKVNDRQMLEYIKGKEKTEATGVLKVVNAMADWTRRFATGVNPVFGVSNMIRDYNSAVTNVGNKIPMGVDDVAGNLIPAYDYLGHAGGKTDPRILEALRIGGPLTFISKEVKGGEVPEIVALFSSKRPKPTVLSSVSRMNEASELATRLGVYDAAKRAGITDENEIRALMRDATVDFTKSGSTMREVNKSIPFINARLQGLRNTIKAIANDPAGQVRKAQIYAMFPQLMVDGMNERYGSLADKISASDRQDFYTPIVGKYVDDKGNEQPTFVRIPKGSMQQIAGLIKDLVEKDSPLTAKEKAEDLIIGMFKMSPMDQMPQLGGPLVTVYRGLQLNKDDRGYEVYPEYLNNPDTPARQKKRSTTSKSIEAVTDFLSKATGGTDAKEGLIELSPAQVEFAIQAGIPGVGGQIVDTADMFRNVIKTGSVNPENRASDTAGSSLAQLPFSSYFVKDRALSAPAYVTERNEETAKQINVVKGGEKEAAMSKLDAIKKAPTKEERVAIAAGVSENERDLITKELAKKSYIYGVEPGSPPMERAVQIFNAMESASDDEKPNIVKQLKANNVVSKDTAKYLAAYRAYAQIKELGTREEKLEVLKKLPVESREAFAEYAKSLKQ